MICVDTNVLVRAAVLDDPDEGRLASQTLLGADQVVVSVVSLCEFVWVLRRAYKKSGPEVAKAVRALVSAPNVIADVAAVEAGLAMLDQGGDFADGAIAHDGLTRGAVEFVSFDRQAVRLLQQAGTRAHTP
ncbi:MAG: type II toxin-antitoxin system VapC family toxin [Propionibacteriaceae bacterium]|nr:type II toxin-antitoxin system VapC family toxin [Propionibacteriaceae bacterium]